MACLGSWIRGKLRRNKTSTTQRPDKWQYPFFPEQRPSCLTRPSSPLSPSSASVSTSSSLFFNKLPLEIRREIYFCAFGNRTVHMDLQFRGEDIRGVGHARIDHVVTELAQELPVFQSVGPEAWRWWSCVCHRASDWSVPLGYDYCRFGRGYCLSRDENSFNECFIGVMGWLLSCRQAYVEVIDILYASNTIFIESNVLMYHIDKLILPQRLASLTSLELYWGTDVGSSLMPMMPIQTTQTFVTVMALLKPSKFTALQNLWINFSNLSHYTRFDDGSVDETFQDYCVDIVLPHADHVAVKYKGQLKKYTIAFPRTFYHDTKERLINNGVSCLDPEKPGLYEQFWRRIPGAASHEDNLPGEGIGYWVREGVDNTSNLLQSMH